MKDKMRPDSEYNHNNNESKKGRGKHLHLWTIILAGIGSMTNIFNNGGTYEPIDLIIKPNQSELWNTDEINRLNPHILEFKIESPHKLLQTEANKRIRKQLELLDTFNDDDDEDWTFIPQEIIDHRVRNIPRKIRRTTKDGKTILQVERTSHMRTRVVWKDGNVSWCAEDALRKQNPFIFIPYIMKNNLQKHKAFLWVKDYINDENINHIYKANKVQKKSPNMPYFKFGTQIPNNPHHAYKLDKINNDKGWEKAMNNEEKSINKNQTFLY